MNEFKNFDLEKEIKIRGRKIHGFVNIAAKPDGSYVKLPVLMAIGKEDGPIVLADGCNHGDEHEGAEAIISVYHTLDVDKMKGTFVGVPVLNMEAFNNLSRYGTSDFVPVDMNRIFPGNEKGTIGQYVAHFYTENFVSKANALITIHGGGNYLYLEPITLYQDNNDELSKKSAEMAKAFGFKYLWKNKDYSESSGFLDEVSYRLGVPSITPEIGGQTTRNGSREKNIADTREGIINVLRLFKIIDEPIKPVQEQINVEIDYLYIKEGGFNKPQKRPGELVKKGECLAIISNLFGEEIDRLEAPFDGVVVGYWAYSVCQPRSWICMLGKVE